MISIQCTFRLDHPVADVYAFVNEPAFEPIWLSSVKKAEAIAEDKLQLLYDFLGKKETFVMKLTNTKDEVRMFEREEGAFHIKGIQKFKPIDDGNATSMEFTFEMDPGKFFGIIPLKIIEKATEQTIKKDGKRLNKLIGSHSLA